MVPTRTRTMLRMKASAVIRKLRMSPFCSQEAARTSRSKRTWSVWVGVKAVKSWLPGRAAAQASSASRSIRWGHQRARPCSKGLGRGGRAGGSGRCARGRRGGRRSRRHDRRGAHGDVVGADAVEAAGQVGRQLGGGREAGHLAAGVDAGVGAAGDGQLDRLAQDGRQAVSSSPCTVRSPGWRAQPRKPEPSYSMSSRTVGIGAVSPTPRIGSVRVLLTNDDGITAPGLQAARRALRELDGRRAST